MPELTIEMYRKADELMRVFRTAVRNAKAESRRLGVANVYVINGVRYFELPNGEMTRTAPQPYAKAIERTPHK